ncbi:MAG: HutD family protein, partial [Sulfobacillus sp.]
GDLVTTSQLIDGPTRDINIMTRRELVRAALTVDPVSRQKKVALEVMKNEELVAIVVSGTFSIRDCGAPLDALGATSPRVSIADPVRTSLIPLDAFHQDGPSSFELSGDGVAVVVRLRNLIAPISNL